MKIRDIISNLELHFPLDKQEDWDHSGLQIGNIDNECHKVLTCLNLDKNTLNQAVQNQCNLIITHHPFIFHPVYSIDFNTNKGYIINELIKHNITVYSMHTNYDSLRMNEMLLEKMGCRHIESVSSDGIVRIGDFGLGITFESLIEQLKNVLQVECVRVVGNNNPKIKTISLCAGSGHDYIDEALAHSDVYITGDLTYSHAMNIIDMKEGCVIDIPHFVEQFFKEDIKRYIDCEVCVAQENDYFKYY